MQQTHRLFAKYPCRFVFRQTVLFFSFLWFAAGCTDDDGGNQPGGAYERGVFILNEGVFPSGSGEISFFDRQTKSIENNVFSSVNPGRSPGTVIQSMLIHEDRAYIVANNSNWIQVVESATFRSVAEITGLLSPRYMVADGDKAYVTEWAGPAYPDETIVGGRVAVIDLTTNTVLKTIPVGKLPEQLMIAGGRLFVANSKDNTISMIDLATETVVTTFTAGVNPKYLTIDKDGNGWALSSGYGSSTTLVKFSPAMPENQTVFTFSVSGGTSGLAINEAKDQLYFAFNSAVYQMNIADNSLPPSPLVTRNFYGIGVDPEENILYGADAGNFTSNGKVIRYDVTTGAALDSAEVSVGPNGFVFR